MKTLCIHHLIRYPSNSFIRTSSVCIKTRGNCGSRNENVKNLCIWLALWPRLFFHNTLKKKKNHISFSLALISQTNSTVFASMATTKGITLLRSIKFKVGQRGHRKITGMRRGVAVPRKSGFWSSATAKWLIAASSGRKPDWSYWERSRKRVSNW